jgi:hypothetical protein
VKPTSAALLVVGALLPAAACTKAPSSGPASPPGPAVDRALISLEVRDGACREITPRFASSPGHVVQWEIRNYCEEDHAVRIANFEKKGASELDPMDCSGADRERTARPGAGHVILTCPVKKDAELGVYTYEVQLDAGAAADPELEIKR